MIEIRETNLDFRARQTRPRTTHLIVHHTAGRDHSAEEIHRMHLDRGWWGIGYHFVIRFDGSIERGRAPMDLGAHAGPDWNPVSEGIALTGNFEEHPPTPAQLDSLVTLLVWRMEIHNLTDSSKSLGHNETGSATLCPGKLMDMDAVRRRAGKALAGPLACDSELPVQLDVRVMVGGQLYEGQVRRAV